MSHALTYCARRAQPLGLEEAQAIDIVIARYQSDFEYREEADVFEHTAQSAAADIIFSGRIRLDEDEQTRAYWTDCLTDIRRVLEDAAWEVCFDSIPMAWDEDDGWLPGADA